MQSREMYLGVIYILVREKVLQADEKRQVRGEGIASTVLGDTSTEGGRLVTMCPQAHREDKLQRALVLQRPGRGRAPTKEEPLPQILLQSDRD